MERAWSCFVCVRLGTCLISHWSWMQRACHACDAAHRCGLRGSGATLHHPLLPQTTARQPPQSQVPASPPLVRHAVGVCLYNLPWGLNAPSTPPANLVENSGMLWGWGWVGWRAWVSLWWLCSSRVSSRCLHMTNAPSPPTTYTPTQDWKSGQFLLCCVPGLGLARGRQRLEREGRRARRISQSCGGPS